MEANHNGRKKNSSLLAAEHVAYGTPINGDVSRSTLSRAIRLHKFAPIWFKKVLNGQYSVSDALVECGLDAYATHTTRKPTPTELKRRKARRRMIMRKKWSLRSALARLEAQLQKELRGFYLYEGSDEEYFEIGQWLIDRGKRWNSLRHGGESCGKPLNLSN